MSSDGDFSSGSCDEWRPPSGNEESSDNSNELQTRARSRVHNEQIDNRSELQSEDQRGQENESRHRGPRGKYSRPSRDTKDLFIAYYEEGMAISEAARRTRMNYNTAKSIIRAYKKCGEVRDDRRGGRKPRKLTEEVLAAIEEYVERNPGITGTNIQRLLQREKNIFVSLTTIRNGLSEVKITLKLATIENEQMNSPQTIELRKTYAREFTEWASQNRDKMIFIDECGFNLHLRRSQARSRRGTRARVTVPAVRGRNVTLIAALTNQKILHYKIISNATCNSARFCIFLRELVEKLEVTPLSDAFLIMDNAKIHKTQQVRDVISSTNLTLKFLPPYSPMLNPIEKCFSKMKAHARSVLGDVNREHNLVGVIEESLQQITSTDCANYVMDMVLLIPLAAEGQPIH